MSIFTPNKKSGFKPAAKKQQTLNKEFLNAFLNLDAECCKAYNVTANGVTEYINRLNNAKYAEGRDEVLTKLVNYRNIRNRFAHEAWYLDCATEITKEDLAWVVDFAKKFAKKKDCLNVYVAEAKKFAKSGKGKKLLKNMKKEEAAAAKKAEQIAKATAKFNKTKKSK